MGEFFKGWRRKIGVLTLVMACVFMAGWVKSHRSFDVFMSPLGKHWVLIVVSTKGAVTCVQWNLPFNELPGFVSHNLVEPWNSIDIAHHYDNQVDENGNQPPKSICVGPVRYWSVVIPLTLLSAYLLLLKPRKKVQPQQA